MWKVLIVEDDRARATGLRLGLQTQGYHVTTVRDVANAVAMATTMDLVILALRLATMTDGDVVTVLERINKRVPVIVLTGRDDVDERVEGVVLGADAPGTQPFNVLNMLAHVGAVLRKGSAGHEDAVERYDFGEVEIDFRSHTATRGGEPLELSPREFELLRYLIERRGRVVTREQLLNAVWGNHGASLTRTVDVHIAKLRKKIGDPPQRPRYILTVHRSGYKFIA